MAREQKTEPPSPRRRRRARREGDHPLSPRAIGFGALGLGLLVVPFVMAALHDTMSELLSDALRPGASPDAGVLAWRVGKLVAPVLGLAAAGALLVGMAQTGGAVSMKPLRWNAQRLSPFAAASDWTDRVVLGAIATLAAAASLGVGWLVLRDLAPALAGSVGDGDTSLRLALEAMRRLAWSFLGVSLLIAGLDAVARHAAWLGRLRMSRDEVRRERREAEGDPDLRQARREIHRELAAAGAARELARTALLVIAEPRLAVGIAYDRERDRAPRVTVHGAGASALVLEAQAPSFGVPIVRDTALGRALASVPVDHEVPASSFAELARALRRAQPTRDV